MELIILLAIAILIMLYRNYEGQNVGRFINDQVTVLYDKFAPYSFKKVREKTKELGQELSPSNTFCKSEVAKRSAKSTCCALNTSLASFFTTFQATAVAMHHTQSAVKLKPIKRRKLSRLFFINLS